MESIVKAPRHRHALDDAVMMIMMMMMMMITDVIGLAVLCSILFSKFNLCALTTDTYSMYPCEK